MPRAAARAPRASSSRSPRPPRAARASRASRAAGGGLTASLWPKVVFALFLGLCVWAGHAYGTLPDVRPLATQNPKSTALIDARAEEAKERGARARRQQRWVRLSQVAPHAVEAVVASEDDRFFDHEGLDLHETKKALNEAWEQKRLGRGASTLTQQLAKNLWLSGDRSLWRKAKELILARRLETALDKNRILELYLNVAEWGEGIYGIEAASRAHFGVAASELSVAQGAVLASMLPAPRKWLPGSGSKTLRARSVRLVERLEKWGRLPRGSAEAARAEIDAIVDG